MATLQWHRAGAGTYAAEAEEFRAIITRTSFPGWHLTVYLFGRPADHNLRHLFGTLEDAKREAQSWEDTVTEALA